MKHYTVGYRLYGQKHDYICVIAKNKEDAYIKAFYEEIPMIEGSLPYSAWVIGVTHNNGNYHCFNTFEGKPY